MATNAPFQDSGRWVRRDVAAADRVAHGDRRDPRRVSLSPFGGAFDALQRPRRQVEPAASGGADRLQDGDGDRVGSAAMNRSTGGSA